MSYNIEEIKKGVKVHFIETKKFKTNIIAIMLTMPLKRESVTKEALIPAVLRRGTNNLKSQEEISTNLENMYGATFDCGIDKTGDNHLLKFYIETINDKFTPDGDNLTQKSIKLLLDIILNPLIDNEAFVDKYVESEKRNLKQIIESKIDNKDVYALNRCIEEMYTGKTYGLYKYGYVEDLENINSKNLYQYYKEMIANSKIDIFISGDFNKQEISETIKNTESIQNLQPREDIHIINNETTEIKENVQIQTVEEPKEITQGKLVIGLDIHENLENSKYVACLYNVILGESATSKLFQNVREKASLAYSARSNYKRQKNNIFIRCGIEIENYEKALKIINEQLEDMKNGKFSEEDIINAKKYMISGIKTVQDEQDSEITYYLGQELSGEYTSFEEYTKNIENVTKEQIQEIANKIKINTIYFLRN